MTQKKPEQYYHIGVMGRELHDYWQKWKPELYQERCQCHEASEAAPAQRCAASYFLRR